MDFKARFSRWTEKVNKELDKLITEKGAPEDELYRAMKYSLSAGGKRLRPVLALAAADILGGSEDEIMPYACAIELIHTYSLIHDDLPAMDNDDFRRGKPTNHKVFGEAIAILAGDALLNMAFERMLHVTKYAMDKLRERISAMEAIAKAAGASGMIGGQVVDLSSEAMEVSIETLEYMHRCKTGALIKAPVEAACHLFSKDISDTERLIAYAEKIGLAFQIKDDIMDVELDVNEMGKRGGSDAANGKSTFVTLYGIQKAKEILSSTVSGALECLEQFGQKAFFLKELAYYIENRRN